MATRPNRFGQIVQEPTPGAPPAPPTGASPMFGFQGLGGAAPDDLGGDIQFGVSTTERLEAGNIGVIRWGGVKMDTNAALERLWQMDAAQKEQIQRQLWTAGMYSDPDYYNGKRRPRFGEIDIDTFEAMAKAASMAPQAGSLEAVLAGTTGSSMLASMGGAEQQTMVGIFEQANPAGIRVMADDLAQRTLGRKATKEEKALLVGVIQSFQVGQQEKAFGTRVAAERADADAAMAAGAAIVTDTSVPVPASDLDKFMMALSGQESGGDYEVENERTGAHGKFQILPSNWPEWSKEAGLGPNASKTPENQERVARFKLSQYLRDFGGDWRAVAAAWYAGPDAGKRWAEHRLTAADTKRHGPGGTEPSIVEYVNSVSDRFKRTGPTALQQPLPMSRREQVNRLFGLDEAGNPLPAPDETIPGQTTMPTPPPPSTAIRTATATVTQADPQAQAEELLRQRNPHEAEMQDWRTMLGSLSQLIGQSRTIG